MCISFMVEKKVRGWEGGREQRREGRGEEREMEREIGKGGELFLTSR